MNHLLKLRTSLLGLTWLLSTTFIPPQPIDSISTPAEVFTPVWYDGIIEYRANFSTEQEFNQLKEIIGVSSNVHNLYLTNTSRIILPTDYDQDGDIDYFIVNNRKLYRCTNLQSDIELLQIINKSKKENIPYRILPKLQDEDIYSFQEL